MSKKVISYRAPENPIELVLFIADNEPNSIKARNNLDMINKKYFKGTAKIRIIDVLEDFQTALENNVLVTPSVLAITPHFRSMIIGNLDEPEKLLATMKLTE